MTAQIDLFEGVRPVARNADPESSHAAKRHLEATGKLTGQRLETLRALAAWVSKAPPPTSYELAGGDVRLRYTFARRLSDLEDGGFVQKLAMRTCKVTGQQALTWAVTTLGLRAIRRSETEQPGERDGEA